MIDLHCHILPGVDDGPADLDATIALARAQVAAGVTRVVATPHVSSHHPNRSEVVGSLVAEVNAALRENAISLDVVAGAEVALDHLPDLPEEELRRLTLGDSSWLLLEPPLTGSLPIESAVSDLQRQGYRILLAHPERCRLFHRDFERLAQLTAAGAACSVTATSLTGDFGKTAQRLAGRLIRNGMVANVASDAHNAENRPPGLSEQVAESGWTEHLQWWSEIVPDAILRDQEVPAHSFEPRPRRRPLGAARTSAVAKTRAHDDDVTSERESVPTATAPVGDHALGNGHPDPATDAEAEAGGPTVEPVADVLRVEGPQVGGTAAEWDERVIVYEAQALAVITRARASALQHNAQLAGLDSGARLHALLHLLADVASQLDEATSESLVPVPSGPAYELPVTKPGAGAEVAQPTHDEPAPPTVDAEDVARRMVEEGQGRIEVEDYLRSFYSKIEARRLARRLLHFER